MFRKGDKVSKRKCQEPDLEKRLPHAVPAPPAPPLPGQVLPPCTLSVFWDTLSSETQSPKMLSPLAKEAFTDIREPARTDGSPRSVLGTQRKFG